MNNSTLCVAADVHLDEILLRAVDKLSGQDAIKPFGLTNNLPGAQSATATIVQVATQLGHTRIEIGCEATGMLWIPFRRLLTSSPLLHPFEVEMVCFNPKLITNFKDGLVLRRPKSDDRDALDVAARLRFATGLTPMYPMTSGKVSTV